ncbi:hypothetical protein ACLB2K_007079 [Fragaria x ananassa]
MGEGASLMEHMNMFSGLAGQLAKVDVKEEDQALLLLTSLPNSYENIIARILYGKDTLNMEKNRRGRTTARGSSGHRWSKSKGRENAKASNATSERSGDT